MAERAPPFLAKSLVKFKSRHPETDLSFVKDEIVRVLAEEDEDWWTGESEDGSRRGIFPKNLVEILPEPEEEEADGIVLPPRPKTKAPQIPAIASTPIPRQTETVSNAGAALQHDSMERLSIASDAPDSPLAVADGALPPQAASSQVVPERPAEVPPTPVSQPKEQLSIPTVPSQEQVGQAAALPSVVKKAEVPAAVPKPGPSSKSLTAEAHPAPPAPTQPQRDLTEVSTEDTHRAFGSSSMNPADAKETIGKGGSLRDRMKLFQAQQEQSQARAAPTPAPKPKAQFKKWEAPPPPPPDAHHQAQAQAQAPAHTAPPVPRTPMSPIRQTSIEQPRDAPAIPSVPIMDVDGSVPDTKPHEEAKSINVGGSLKERIALIKAQQEAQRLATESRSQASTASAEQERPGASSSTEGDEASEQPRLNTTEDNENPSHNDELGPKSDVSEATEDSEAARRTRLAQRMAALGGRGMGMNPFGPPPPIPRKIRSEVPEESKPIETQEAVLIPSAEQAKKPTMPAIPRRAGPPPRRKHTGSSVSTLESDLGQTTTEPSMPLQERTSETPAESVLLEEPYLRESGTKGTDTAQSQREDAESILSQTEERVPIGAGGKHEIDDDVDEITASYAAEGLKDEQDEQPIASAPSRPKGVPPGAFNLFGGAQPARREPKSERQTLPDSDMLTHDPDSSSRVATSRRPLPVPPPIQSEATTFTAEDDGHSSRQRPVDEDTASTDDEVDEREEASDVEDADQDEEHSTASLQDRATTMVQPGLASPSVASRGMSNRPMYSPASPPPFPGTRSSVEGQRQNRPPVPTTRPPVPTQPPAPRRSIDMDPQSPITPTRQRDLTEKFAEGGGAYFGDDGDFGVNSTSLSPPVRSAPPPAMATRPPPPMPKASDPEEASKQERSRPSVDSKRSIGSSTASPRPLQETTAIPQQYISPTVQRRPSPSSSSSYLRGQFKAEDIDLAPQTRWWRLQPVALPFALASRCDPRNPARDAIFKSNRGQIGDNREQLELVILYDDYSSSVLYVQYDETDQNVDVGQRHQAPPPIDGSDHLAYVSTQVGQRLIANAKSQLGKVVADGTSYSFVEQVLRSTGGSLEPIGYTFGVTILVSPSSAAPEKLMHTDEPRPGDIVILSHARFSGRKGLSSYTQHAGEGPEPSLGFVSEYEGKKGKDGKLRVLLQKPNEPVELASFRPGDLRSGTLKVQRVMMENWVHHWSKHAYI